MGCLTRCGQVEISIWAGRTVGVTVSSWPRPQQPRPDRHAEYLRSGRRSARHRHPNPRLTPALDRARAVSSSGDESLRTAVGPDSPSSASRNATSTIHADARVVILGAPFNGGTSARSGARFGPMATRMRDYLGHDGSRLTLALSTDGLVDLQVVR